MTPKVIKCWELKQVSAFQVPSRAKALSCVVHMGEFEITFSDKGCDYCGYGHSSSWLVLRHNFGTGCSGKRFKPGDWVILKDNHLERVTPAKMEKHYTLC